MDFQTHSTGVVNNRPIRFVTLTKADPDFSAHMNGQGGDGLRAVPVESFGVNSRRERVTFALYEPVGSKWNLFRGFVTVARLDLLPLSLGPLLLGVVASLSQGPVAGHLVMSMMISMVCLHVAAFARNDVADHQTGIDRIQRRRGSQAIQRGWISVAQVRWIGKLALLTGALSAIPLLVDASTSLWFLMAFGLTAILGFSISRGFKALGFGDLIVGLCMGPLITFGVGEVLGSHQSLWLSALGVPLGLAAVIVFQIRQFESILAERQVESGTLVARLGFDRSKSLLHRELLLLPLIMVAILWPWVKPAILIGVAAAVWVGQLRLAKKLRSAQSPLASQLVGLGRQAAWFHLWFVVLLMAMVGLIS